MGMRAVAVGAWFLPAAWACSYVEIPVLGANGSVIYHQARTMELGDILGLLSYSVDVIPGSATGGKHGYVAPMSMFSIGTDQILKVAFDGMNEAGLSISALELKASVYEVTRNKTEEEQVDQDDKPTLEYIYVVSHLLANSDNVSDALANLEKIKIAETIPHIIPMKQGLHWAITDASGRSVVVEYLAGKRVVFENTPRVLTNDPPLDWHWRNLNNYVNLNTKWPNFNEAIQAETSVGTVPSVIGNGQNLWGMPGDLSPPSRFVRLFYLKSYGVLNAPPKNRSEAVMLGTAILNNVFIPYGTVPADPKLFLLDAPEYTAYGMIKSSVERIMLVRAYTNSQWRMVDLKNLDFTKFTSWPLEDGTLGVRDISDESEENEAGAFSPPPPPAGIFTI